MIAAAAAVEDVAPSQHPAAPQLVCCHTLAVVALRGPHLCPLAVARALEGERGRRREGREERRKEGRGRESQFTSTYSTHRHTLFSPLCLSAAMPSSTTSLSIGTYSSLAVTCFTFM